MGELMKNDVRTSTKEDVSRVNTIALGWMITKSPEIGDVLLGGQSISA